MDTEKSDLPRKRMSTASFATTVFQESTIGTVSTFCLTTSKPRKVFKVVSFILCLTGFLYQGGKFLSAVFEYPTRVNLDISRPDILISPAYTFCDNNGLNRRIFCSEFPYLCEKPSEEFCEKHEYYCGKNRSLVPTKENYEWKAYMDIEELVSLNVNLEEFVTVTKGSNNGENITGPYLRLADMAKSRLLCYSLFTRVNNSLDVHHVAKNKFARVSATEFQFNVRSDEMFYPGKRSGVLFSLHNPFEVVNPFETGVFMKPGRDYVFFVSMEEEVMLEEPYDTKCINYTKIWEENGRIGPRMQETCLQNCLADISLRCFHCLAPIFKVETTERTCGVDDYKISYCPDISHKLDDVVSSCIENCRDDCRKTKFDYTVQERFRPRFDEMGEEIEDMDSIINVKIYLEGDEIIVVRHSPKYMIVEVFSSIGGFIGCWLGINLLHIADIFEGLFRIMYYSLKRK